MSSKTYMVQQDIIDATTVVSHLFPTRDQDHREKLIVMVAQMLQAERLSAPKT